LLVLSRHIDESIVIGDDIIVTVLDIRGDKIRLGISAPRSIRVDRSEIRELIDRERRAAEIRSPVPPPDRPSPAGGPRP
jgi:carbon storage regulator